MRKRSIALVAAAALAVGIVIYLIAAYYGLKGGTR